MTTPWITTLIALGLLVIAATATAAGSRDLSDAEYTHMLDLVMDGRTDAAADHLAALAETCAGRPLYLLAQARLQLEQIPVDDDDKTVTGEAIAPALARLDEVIGIADRGLAADPDRLDLRYYRGWAWMVHSQLRAYARSFYSAGRDAGRGKADLEAYLAVHPDHPIANGLLGSFLYFTDAVPQLFQFLSKLLFLPTGDRERGLAMIGRAAGGESIARVDFEVLQAAVTFFFEGRLEDGLARSNDLLDRYPHYPRLGSAAAVMAALDPIRAVDHAAGVERMLTGMPAGPGIDASSSTTVRGLLGWSLRITAGHDRARELLADIAADPPRHPDWAASHARLQLAQMAALEGRPDEARRLAEMVRDDPLVDRFSAPAERLLADLVDVSATGRDPVEDAWVAAVYTAEPDSLPILIARLDAHAATSIRAAFHAADARLLAGDRRAASRAYRELHRREFMAWEQPYRMLAAARLGELAAADGNWRSAENWFERAADDHQDLYRMEWLLQGRGRHMKERGAADRVGSTPLLFATDNVR